MSRLICNNERIFESGRPVSDRDFLNARVRIMIIPVQICVNAVFLLVT